MITFDDLLQRRRRRPLEASVDSRDLAQIVYTSGTESLPKGAMLTHDAVMWQYVSCVVDAEHRAPTNDAARAAAVPLRAARRVPGPGDLRRRHQRHHGQADARQPAAADRSRTASRSFFAPPTVWIALLRSPLFDQTDLSTLRKGYYGASIMPVEVLREIARRLPNVRLLEPLRPDRDRAARHHARPEDQLRKPGSCRQRRAERRDARRRRLRCEDVKRRRGRRDRAPLAAPDARLLPRRRAHRGRVRRRLVPLAATSRPSTTRATSPSSTARRT